MAATTFHGRYDILELLGSGAFGYVYSASLARGQPGRAGALVVKVLDMRSETRQRVLEEAEMLRVAAHSGHCASFVEAIFEGPLAYIVMERCDRPLSVALACQPVLHEHVLASFFRQSLKAAAAIHAAGVVHRDIKPDSFMCCGAENTVKMIDFGLATRAPRSGERLYDVCGTAPFMAPEMLQGSGYGVEVDVWALGVMAYVLLLGQFPYAPSHMASRSMKEAIRTGTPAPSFSLAEGVRPLLNAGTSISNDGIGLLRLLLLREAPSRPTAEGALEHCWVKSCDSRGGAGRRGWRAGAAGPCLKQALMAAANLHAFDPAPVSPALAEAEAKAQEAQDEVGWEIFRKLRQLARRRLAPPPRMACDEAPGADKNFAQFAVPEPQAEGRAQEAEDEVGCETFFRKLLQLARRRLAPPPRMACDEAPAADKKFAPPAVPEPQFASVIAFV